VPGGSSIPGRFVPLYIDWPPGLCKGPGTLFKPGQLIKAISMEVYELAKTEIVKSVCDLCSSGCGVLITLKDGKPDKITGDPESPPNRGGLCKIGLASLEYKAGTGA
jgi:anaerobic selenocysteine-containing dehydrogenase